MKTKIQALLGLGRALPTGPNPLTPLDQFTIVQGPGPVAFVYHSGPYRLTIDTEREVGHFEHEAGLHRGRVWLAGQTLLGAEPALPRDVQRSLIALGYEVA